MNFTFLPNAVYTIDLEVFHRSGLRHGILAFGLQTSLSTRTLGRAGTVNQQEMWIGDNPFGVELNTFHEASSLHPSIARQYRIETGDAPPEGNVVIFLQHLGGFPRVQFDNVRLNIEYTVVPEPGAFLLLALAVPVLASRHRRRA